MNIQSEVISIGKETERKHIPLQQERVEQQLHTRRIEDRNFTHQLIH